MGDEQQDAANPQQEPDLMGYDNVETLVNAKRASDVEARRLFEENARLKAILEVQAANPRPEVRNRYEEELANAGVPVDPLEQYVSQKVGQAIQAAFQPIARQLEGQVQARSYLVSQYGNDYLKFEQDAWRHVQSNPDLQQRYNNMAQGDPIGAAEFAFLKFSEQQRRSHPSDRPSGDEDRSSRAQASIPTSKRTDRRRPSDDKQSAVDAAFERYTKNPSRQNAEAYASARFKQAVPDEWLFGSQTELNRGWGR